MSSQIITGLWGPNSLGNYSVTKIASEHTNVITGTYFVGKFIYRQLVYTSTQSKNIETTPPPSNNYDSTVHVFVSYTMVQMFALLISFH